MVQRLLGNSVSKDEGELARWDVLFCFPAQMLLSSPGHVAKSALSSQEFALAAPKRL